MTFDARKKALAILNKLEEKQQTLDGILENLSTQKQTIARRERALLNALVYGVLRWRGHLDYIIEHFSTTPLNKITPQVMNILRLGLFQIIYLDRIPKSAAVNTSVEMVKSIAPPWVVRFTNAVLRKAGNGYPTVPYPDSARLPVKALAIRKSFPEWLIARWLKRFGQPALESLCDGINTIPPITVRANTLKTSRPQLRQALDGDVEKIDSTSHAPEGLFFFNPKVPIPNLAAFKHGAFQVQDEAAQLVSLILDPQPGERVLDACAGLGGKTGHIAQLMQNRGEIIAADKSTAKLSKLNAEMHRLGISIVSAWHQDLETTRGLTKIKRFDRILLDAPCSGLGTLRRNPDIKWMVSKQNLKRYTEKQIKLLENMVPLVNCAGFLVYAVCSTEPEENEDVVNAFLKNHPEFVIDKCIEDHLKKYSAFADPDGYFRTYPQQSHLDGFFFVRLKRIK
jgi:16S rRNA (cytosine967-C5)-methyltransferase